MESDGDVESDGDEESQSETTSPVSASDGSKPTPSRSSIPSFSKLKKLSGNKVLKHLKDAVELSQCSSRRELGVSLSCSDKNAKDRIDYLMKKHDLTNEGIGLKT
jgi:sulfite reductase alpha subunit-like flavoprotein